MVLVLLPSVAREGKVYKAEKQKVSLLFLKISVFSSLTCATQHSTAQCKYSILHNHPETLSCSYCPSNAQDIISFSPVL